MYCSMYCFKGCDTRKLAKSSGDAATAGFGDAATAASEPCKQASKHALSQTTLLNDDDADDDVISWRNPPGILCRPRFCVVLFMVRYVIPDRLVVVLLFSGVCRDLGVVLALTL